MIIYNTYLYNMTMDKNKKTIYIDLYNNTYTEEELLNNIHVLDIRNILETQKLTLDFCHNVILDIKNHKCIEDSYLDMSDIYKYQPHLRNDK